MKTCISTSQVNKVLARVSLFCFILISQACNGIIVSPTPSAAPLPSFTPTLEDPEYVESSDCLWSASGKAWNDDNQNGVWNSGEKPLPNIKFWVDDTLNGYQKVNELYSDTVSTNVDGNVEIIVGLPGCPEVTFEVYTEAPQNCELTTEERIPVNFNSQYAVYSFGFVCH